MSSLLPDDYMATAAYESALLEQSPECGFDDSSAGYEPANLTDDWRPISHGENQSTFDDPSNSSSGTSYQSTHSLAQSAPVYYQLASMSLPTGGFAVPSSRPFAYPSGLSAYPSAHYPLHPHHHNQQPAQQHAQLHQMHSFLAQQPAGTTFSSNPHSVPATGAFPNGMAYPSASDDQYGIGDSELMYHHAQSHQAAQFSSVQQATGRGRARNASAPAVPVMMMMGPPVPNSNPGWQMTAQTPNYDYPMSSSYDSSSSAYLFSSPVFPMTPERKFGSGSSTGSAPSTSSRSASRGRRPVGVPALSFSGLHSSGGISSPLSASTSMLTPHSGRSNLSSVSDYDSQFSPMSTPRSASSTPRSSTSTPRSGANEKKRARTGIPHPLERERRVRPKVIAEKGALQCKGVNRKKNTRCRNAALMEYIGPRPLYCAEHITLDPESFYSKCASSYHKVHGDGKGCREVVLKELQFCHKHYNQSLDVLLDGSELGFVKARTQLERISTLQTQLEAEASAAKRVDPDLFQRKHKLIPKFMEMRKLLVKRMQELESSFGHLMPANTKLSDFDTALPSPPSPESGTPDEKYYPIAGQQEHADSKDSTSATSSPSGSSDEASCNYDESPASLMMQVETHPHMHQHYSVY